MKKPPPDPGRHRLLFWILGWRIWNCRFAIAFAVICFLLIQGLAWIWDHVFVPPVANLAAGLLCWPVALWRYLVPEETRAKIAEITKTLWGGGR